MFIFPKAAVGSPTPLASSPTTIVCNDSSFQEFWYTYEADNSGAQIPGSIVTKVNKNEPFVDTYDKLGATPEKTKLVARNTSTVDGSFTLTITIQE